MPAIDHQISILSTSSRHGTQGNPLTSDADHGMEKSMVLLTCRKPASHGLKLRNEVLEPKGFARRLCTSGFELRMYDMDMEMVVRRLVCLVVNIRRTFRRTLRDERWIWESHNGRKA